MAGNEEPAAFSFGPRDRRGLIAGARGGQLVVLGGSLVLAVLAARSGTRLALPAAAVVVVAAAAFGWLPVGGRTPEEWLPVCLRHLLRAPARRPPARPGGSRTLPSRPSAGARRSVAAGSCASRRSGLELVETAAAGRRLGIVLDRRMATASAVLAVGGAGFSLLDQATQLRLVAAWSGILASCAEHAGAVHRLQWVERTLPPGAPCDELAAPWSVVAHGGGDRPPAAALAAARRSYDALIAAERGFLVHELLLVLTVRASRGRRGELAPTTAGHLAGELAGLERRCAAVGLACGGALDPGTLAATLRRAGEARPQRAFGCGSPWPVPGRLAWSAVQAGALWHTTYWVAEWPRHEVGCDFLLPLLLSGQHRRSVSLVMAPVAPARALRAAEQARTARAADAALRGRHGFATTARSRREEEAVLRRERELAAGHAGYRFSGYVTVSAAGRDELAEACRRLEQAAALARLQLRRLDGQQDEAFLFSLPVGRGCW